MIAPIQKIHQLGPIATVSPLNLASIHQKQMQQQHQQQLNYPQYQKSLPHPQYQQFQQYQKQQQQQQLYRTAPRAIVSMPQGFKKPQVPKMTEALVSIKIKEKLLI
jgi:hypothetical protein